MASRSTVGRTISAHRSTGGSGPAAGGEQESDQTSATAWISPTSSPALSDGAAGTSTADATTDTPDTPGTTSGQPTPATSHVTPSEDPVTTGSEESLPTSDPPSWTRERT